VLALVGALAAWVIFEQTSIATLSLSADMQAMVFALVSIPSVLAMTAALYGPGVRRLLGLSGEAPAPGARWQPALTRNAGLGT
jgi:hypothetical protein